MIKLGGENGGQPRKQTTQQTCNNHASCLSRRPTVGGALARGGVIVVPPHHRRSPGCGLVLEENSSPTAAGGRQLSVIFIRNGRYLSTESIQAVSRQPVSLTSQEQHVAIVGLSAENFASFSEAQLTQLSWSLSITSLSTGIKFL